MTYTVVDVAVVVTVFAMSVAAGSIVAEVDRTDKASSE